MTCAPTEWASCEVHLRRTCLGLPAPARHACRADAFPLFAALVAGLLLALLPRLGRSLVRRACRHVLGAGVAGSGARAAQRCESWVSERADVSIAERKNGMRKTVDQGMLLMAGEVAGVDAEGKCGGCRRSRRRGLPGPTQRRPRALLSAAYRRQREPHTPSSLLYHSPARLQSLLFPNCPSPFRPAGHARFSPLNRPPPVGQAPPRALPCVY